MTTTPGNPSSSSASTTSDFFLWLASLLGVLILTSPVAVAGDRFQFRVFVTPKGGTFAWGPFPGSNSKGVLMKCNSVVVQSSAGMDQEEKEVMGLGLEINLYHFFFFFTTSSFPFN